MPRNDVWRWRSNVAGASRRSLKTDSLLLLAGATVQNRLHRVGVHDSEVLVAVVEDDICALDTPLIQLYQVGRNRPELTLRIQILVALGRGDVVLNQLSRFFP
jgi:predicted secreted protein